MIRITLADYDSRWPQQFEEHRRRIAAALGRNATRIEHVGSTSVPGLAAKPIVDIIVDGIDPSDETARAAFESAGYHVAVDEPGHRLYKPSTLDAHVHLWSDPADSQHHVIFRDWLRMRPADRALYEHVKRRLATREWPTSNHYAEAKNAVVRTIMRRARGEESLERIDAFFALLMQHLPAHARVLEIGAGEALLAEKLAGAGHEITALEPQLCSRFLVIETPFESYEAPKASFDCIVSQLALHHVSNLDVVLEKIEMLLAPDGSVAIDDYGWERSADSTFRSERSDLHTSHAMLAALRERFSEVYYADTPYVSDGTQNDSLGFTFLGRRR